MGSVNHSITFDNYDVGPFFDESISESHAPRPSSELLIRRINELPEGELIRRQEAAERSLFRMGITFNVYGDSAGAEKIFPFDIVPRVIDGREWQNIEEGLEQRIRALNLFIHDVYHEQEIVAAGVLPEFLLETCDAYRKECKGISPPMGVWCHITGTDLIRGDDGQFYVLEDNLRCPSGVSYVLQNRFVMKRSFPSLFDMSHVRPVDDYPGRLQRMLQRIASRSVADPNVAVLTPGPFNSAYYEHSFLAQQMGAQLVEGRDLVVRDHFVYSRTTKGFERIDVIYRRVDDDFIDPLVFRSDSMLGVPGLMEAYRRGNVALANAPGTGIADDKAIYSFVPEMIQFYLGEEAILPNVPTYLCYKDDDRAYVLENLDSLVVKAVGESGGYGMLIGPSSTAAEQSEFAAKIREKPRNYIAQPTIQLSRAPTLICDEQGARFEGRHVDLRPYILFDGDEVFVLPGGLTRVALRKGSLVVNSSQGGGSKDTWVVATRPPR
jgi:uncharacterized circularly permuted ATP-grasp superfamily protein